MTNYLDILAETIRTNWDQPALTDFYLTEDGTAQDTSRGNHYTYGEMYAELCRVAELLTSLGLQKGDHIAICGANSAHWVIAYLAIAKMQGVSVTVMHTIQPDEIVRLVTFSDAKALFTDPDIWSELSPSLERVKSSARSDARWSSVEQIGERFISLADWSLLDGCSDRAMTVKRNRRTAECPVDSQGISAPREFAEQTQNSLEPRRPRENQEITFPSSAPDDLAMICFTSGTSGNAKGVMLSYRNISYTVAYQVDYLKRFERKNTISLLPLGHIYGCIDEFVRNMYLGTHVCILKNAGTPNRIMQSYQVICPSYVVLVPFLLQYFIQLFGESPHSKSINSFFGNRIEKVFVAAAALSPTVEKKLLSIGLPLLKGYGATECSPSIANSITCENRVGSVGKAVAETIIRISPSGEILVKGENVMLGYYKDPEATAAKIDADGWLHTGDKGHLDEDGYLYVEGRLEQDIIVLPNGENIRPDNIEALINALPEVKESIVLARDGKLVAIAVLSSPSLQGRDRVRLSILRTVNPQLPLFSQLYDVEITDTPLQRTEKQTLKRYLYE